MEFEIKMPDLSTNGGDLTVLKWLVDEGGLVKRGEALFEVETDKATMDVESTHSGVLKKKLVQESATVAPGTVIAIVEVQRPSVTLPGPPNPTVTQGDARQGNIDGPTVANEPVASNATRPRVGMFGRNRANREQSNTTTTPLSATQRVVARRMLQSKQTIPHYYLQTSACVDSLCKSRAESGRSKIAWDAYFVCAVARSLQRFPKICHRYQDDCLIAQNNGVVGVAVDLDGDLYVLPITDAANRTAAEVSETIRAGCEKLKNNTDESLKQLQAADFTITNLGMTAVESFAPIINPPEAAILGIGRVQPQPVVVDSQIAIRQRVTLTLAVDHRIVNGKYAADFLSDIVSSLENF